MEKNPILKIKSEGPINEADIEIKKINIVGGVNGSGKTTVAKILYCFLKVLSEKKALPLYKEFVDRVNSFIENFNRTGIDNLKEDFKYDDSYKEVLNEFLIAKNLFFEHGLDKMYFPSELSYDEGYNDFFGREDFLIESFEEGGIELNLRILDDMFKQESMSNFRGGDISFKFDSFNFMYNNIKESSLKYDMYIPDVFYIDTNSFFELSDGINFSMEHVIYLKDTLNEEPQWWIDLCSVIPEDVLNYMFEDEDILMDFDDRLPKDLKDLINNAAFNFHEKHYKKILSKMDNMMHGRYYDRAGAKGFKKLDKSTNSKIIDVSYPYDTPSGIKQVGTIQILLLKGKLKKGSYLIIDEPEVNLHPEWQFKFAEILVLLARELDITLYINSHSPMFIESIDAFIEFYDMENEVNYYLTEELEIDYKYNFTNINQDELYKIYDNLGKPYDLIDELRLRKHLGE